MSKAAKAFEKNHWGHKHTQVIDTNTPDLDRHLKKHQPKHLGNPEISEWGGLVGFGFLPFDKVNPQGKAEEEKLELSNRDMKKNHLVYDPYHPHQRLYFILAPDLQKEVKKEFWTKSREKAIKLPTLARRMNGRHGTADYPSILVKPVGEMTYIDYLTDKKSDGLSIYRHTLGEESGIRPEVAVDAKGRLWFLGGDYYSTEAGIIN